MLVGIGDVEFVVQSIRQLDDAADGIAREVKGLEKNATAMVWTGDDRRDFDRGQAELLVELRGVEKTIRAEVTELRNILRDQKRASGGGPGVP